MIKDFSVSIICKDSTFKISQSEDYSKLLIISKNKKTPEGVYAGCVGVRKNYRYVGWQ